MVSHEAGDGPSTSSTAVEIPIEEMFFTRRISSLLTRYFIFLYFPIGSLIFLLRTFIGVHLFLIACLLRKTTALRSTVLRVMCGVLGIVVVHNGKRDDSARVLTANHVSVLDHLAVDLISPCLLPSVWDIPTVVRWCFGYVELGASRGRNELVRQAKELIASDPLPLLAFPEGVITSGQRALLKFSTWAFEVSDRVQPVAVRVWRPSLWALAPSHLVSSWWSDVFCFFALPFTTINLVYLPAVDKNDDETREQFSQRVAQVLADELQLEVSRFDASDAAEAAKRWTTARESRRAASSAALSTGGGSFAAKVPLRASSSKTSRVLKPSRLSSPRALDEATMRIKQSYPGHHLCVIRRDLERTRNQQMTVDNIKNGKLSKELGFSMKVPTSADTWKKVFDERKWQMIEENRSKYLGRPVIS